MVDLPLRRPRRRPRTRAPHAPRIFLFLENRTTQERAKINTARENLEERREGTRLRMQPPQEGIWWVLVRV